MFFECNANPPSFGLWRVGPTGGSRLACKRQRWPWQAWPPWTPLAPVALGAALHPRLGHRRGSPGSRRDMARSRVGTHGLGDPPPAPDHRGRKANPASSVPLCPETALR